MSHIIEKLLKTDRAASQPMGFKAAHSAAAEQRLLIFAGLSSPDIEELPDYLDGADAVLLRPGESPLPTDTVKTLVASLDDIPVGIHMDGLDTAELKPLLKAGCDFVVFPATCPVSAIPEDDDTGSIIQVESSLDDGLLRAINDLPTDAAIITDSFEDVGTLVWHQLMIVRHVTALMKKPVIIPVSLKATESELKSLWEAGVGGVIVEVDVKKRDGIKKLRGIIEKLPARSAPKKGKAEALLPYPGGARETKPEEEEEEEYE